MYTLTLDLVDDPALIQEYEKLHEAIWPEIQESILASGITQMQIFRYQTRLFMIIETKAEFSFEKKAAMDAENPVVQRWEQMLWKYQKALPGAKPGEKWQVMQQIFSLR